MGLEDLGAFAVAIQAKVWMHPRCSGKGLHLQKGRRQPLLSDSPGLFLLTRVQVLPLLVMGMQYEERAALLTWELWGQGPVLMEVWLPGPNWEGNRGPQEWSGWGLLGLVSLLMELQPGRGRGGDLLVP